MQPAAISSTNTPLRPKFSRSTGSNPLAESITSRYHNVTKFPLRSSSKDLFLVLEEDQSEAFTQFLSDDRKLHLKLLQVASAPPTSDKQSESSWTANFDNISPSIINTHDKYQGAAPIHYACLNGNTQLVTFLLGKGADVNIWDEKRRVTPLMCAAVRGSLEICKILLENGSNVDAGINGSNNGQYSALMWSIKRSHVNIVNFLLANNACQNSTVTFSETPAHAAVMSGCPEVLRILLNAQDKSVRLDFQMGPEKATALHLAASSEFDNSFEMCKILIEEGNVSINPLNADERTPLFDAVASQNIEVVRYLLMHFAKVNAVDTDGRTPLFYALGDEEESLECIQALIDTEKCNLNHQDKLGHTALHLSGVYGSTASAEVLLLNGADFSIKAEGGASALSILLKEIPSTSALLHKAFDQAVTLTHFDESPTKRHDSKVEVDFKYVLPSASTAPNTTTPPPSLKRKGTKAARFRRVTTIFGDHDEEDNQEAIFTRKETTKLKCLVDEELSSLLLHPVIQSFLELKWQKARRIFIPTLTFRILYVLLFSTYVLMPYYAFDVTDAPKLMMNTITDTEETTPTWFSGMFYAIVILTILKGLGGLAEILLAPKRLLKSITPWIAWAVLSIVFYHMKPDEWKSVCTCDPFRRAMAALAILLAWLDVWIDISAFPKIGLSIRVFFRVLKNFSYFILPHCCLMIGFVLAFTLLFPDSGEFQSFVLGLTKVIRIMAGDITIVTPGQDKLEPDSTDEIIFSRALLVYIYTAFVVMVAIVLGNLILGLAVHDIQGIYKDAAEDKLSKQVILLHVLETSFHGWWARFCLPKEVFAKHINLFPSSGLEDKIKTFSPYDPSDWHLGSERKKALLNIGSVNRVSKSEETRRSSVIVPLRVKANRMARTAFRKRVSTAFYADDRHRQLMENINQLVLSYLENQT